MKMRPSTALVFRKIENETNTPVRLFFDVPVNGEPICKPTQSRGHSE